MELSLVQAIQQASPLSGPLDDSVFSEIVTMQFAAHPVEQIFDASLKQDGDADLQEGNVIEINNDQDNLRN